jgi:histidine triad (HIT) family protein
MDCIFCKIISGEIPAEIVHRDDEIAAFRDINPKAPVHLLVVPVKHVETVLNLKETDEKLVGRMVRLASELAGKEGIAEKGFRLVFNCREHGGQEVYHLHLHVLGGRVMRWPPG